MEIEEATRYKKNNVGQCWRCKNHVSEATFADRSGDTVKYYRLPECALHKCYITEITEKTCQDYKRDRGN